MHLSVFCCILVLLSQDSSRIESLSLSSSTQQKIQGISQWLDSLTDASVYDYIFRVNKGLGLNLFEGDIAGYNPKHQVRTAITNKQQIWNTRVVPYVIDGSFSSDARKDIMAAIDEYHQKTCIRWVPHSNQKDYVHFKQISGCYSNIGRTGGEQDISLMGACLKKGTAVHEMMHALGFWHEQSRPDRDSWVHVINSNIQGGKEYNFQKLPTTDVDTLGVQYDYDSVMHYSKYAFTKNGNPTLMPTHPPDANIGQRDGLSDHDVLRITRLYGCDIPAATPAPTTKPPVQTKPVETKPPVTQPPQTQPPQTQPPQTQPPQTQPPQTQPPQTQPPQTQPPQTQPPQTQPPQTQPPQTQPPQTQPPQTQPPQTQPPQTQPPQTQPPQTQPPVTQPPQTQPPQTQPPQTQPPQTQPPQTQPPQTQPAETLPPQVNPTLPPETTSLIINPFYTGWTGWSSWSTCDLRCLHSRYRICLSYDNSYCPGENNQVVTCPEPCKTSSSLGCWNMDKNNIPIPSLEGFTADLMDPYTVRTEAVRKCSSIAAMLGYTIFALFDGGKCLTGPNAASQFAGAGPSGACDYRGVGSSIAASVYTFAEDIDGQWSPWSEFGHCTRSCGMGRQYRYRRCDNPPPIGAGAPCDGDESQVAICNQATCVAPIKCGTRYHAGGPGSSGLIWLRDYDNFMECEYEIATGDLQASISIFVHQINIEYSKGCVYDSLMLFDGHSSSAPMVGSFCGNSIPGTFESSSNRIYLKFESDETNTDQGFTVFYNINSRSRKACVKPPPAAHAVVTMEGNMVGNRVWYQCEPGFQMAGRSPITCLDQPGFALWDDAFPRCVKVYKRSISSNHGMACTFDDSLCGYTNENRYLSWKVKRPITIHTNATEDRNSTGNYLYAESNRFQQPGDVGQVTSAVYTGSHQTSCFRFAYTIDGGELVSLRVVVKPVPVDVGNVNETIGAVDEQDEGVVVMEMAGNEEEDVWHIAAVNVESITDFQIVFEAALGKEIGSSIGIDDIVLTNGPCGTIEDVL